MTDAAAVPVGDVFVGRRAELETLREFTERTATSGRGHLVLVGGEAGIGKTSLFEQLSARSALPARWGACWSDGGRPPYWPWTQVLRADPPVRAAPGSPLAVLLSEVAAGPAPDRFTVHEAVVAALRDTGPAIVVLDDLHWVDDASAALLVHLARSLARVPLLVVAGYRDTDIAPGSPIDVLLGTLARTATTMSLGGLAVRDVAELLESVTGRADDALVAEVHLQSDGNALFAIEVAKLVTAEGGFARVPPGLAAVIKERLAGFDDATTAALEAAAVLGPSCSVDEVGAVVGRPALAALAAPLGTRVLRSGGRPGEVRFTHALVRRAIVEGLTAPRLVELHAAATRALAPGADRERAARLAAHAVAAVPLLGPGPALEWSRRAADAAAAGLGHADAARHLATVVELVDARERPRALLDLGRMLAAAGDTGGALDAFRRGLPMARDGGHAELFARFVLAVAGCLPPFAAPAEIMGLINEARGLVGPDEPVQVELAGQRWMRVLMSGTADAGDRHAAEAWAAEVVQRARDDDDPPALHRAWAMQYPLLMRCDRVDERLRIATGEAELADRTGELPIAADAGVHLLLAGVERADRLLLDDGLRRLRDVERLDRRPVRTMFLLTRRAMVAEFRGDLDAAVHDLDAADRLATRADLPEFAVGNAVLRACLAHDTGAPAPPAAIRTLTGFFGAAPGLGFGPGVLALRALLENADRGDDADRERADELLARVLAAAPAAPQDALFSGLAGMTVLAEVVVRQRLVDPARRLRPALEPFAELTAVVALAAACVGPVAHALGLLCDLLGEPAAADRWFELALAKARALGSRQWEERVSAARSDSLAGRDGARAAALRGAGTVGAPRGAAADRPRARLHRDGRVWLVEHEAVTARLPHTKGLVYLAELVRHPGRERRALDLVALVEGHDERRGQLGDTGPALDAQAKAAYRTRLAQLRAGLDAADEVGDEAASARAQAEIDALVAELGRAVGLGGRDRPIGSAAEKARLNVTRAIRASIGRIGQSFPALGEHLTASVHTGMSCCYLADEPLFGTD